MSKAPAFQLYAADFYTDTMSWTATSVGVYFRLLMHEWINGPLPTSMAKLARIAGVDARNMQKMWSAELAKKFVSIDGEREGAKMYVNLRLEQTRKEQDDRRQKQAESGRKGGLKTQEERREHTSDPSSKPSSDPSSEIEALQSSSSIPSKKKKVYRGKFPIPPPIEDVILYCKERSNGIDPHKWFDHYEARGWMIGKNRMKDWKAAVRTWEQNEFSQERGKTKTQDDVDMIMALTERTIRGEL